MWRDENLEWTLWAKGRGKMLAETTQHTSQKKHLKTSREVYQRLEENISGCQFLMLGLCVIFLGAGTGKYSWDVWIGLLKSEFSG